MSKPDCVLQPPLTMKYNMNIDKGVNLTLTNYNCNNILGVCVSQQKDACKDVDPIIIFATDATKNKINMYLPLVGNIVARKFTDMDGTTYYGFVTQYVLETDIQEFDYDLSTKMLSITDGTTTYTSALINKPITVGNTSYCSFVLAPPVPQNASPTVPYTKAPVNFVPTTKPPPPPPSPPNKNKLSTVAIIFICVGALALILILIMVGKRMERSSNAVNPISS